MDPLLFVVATGSFLLLRRWFLKKQDYTIGCAFGRHENCSQHLRCTCPHHDEIIMKEMSR